MTYAHFLWLQTVGREGVPFLTSWGGGISLALSFTSLASVLIGYGRWLEKLNGVGKRVTALEQESTTAKAEREHFARSLDKIDSTLQQLSKDLGRHERGTEACREDTENLGIKLGSEIHNLTNTVSAMDKNVSVRLAQIETTLKERGTPVQNQST